MQLLVLLFKFWTSLCQLVFGRRRPMFSLVVSVPRNTNTGLYDASAVTDDSRTVRDRILNCDVYVGRRVVAATVLRWPNVLEQCPGQPIQWRLNLRGCHSHPRTWAQVQSNCPRNTIPDGKADHAEFRTLQNIGPLVSNHREGSNDLLVFYVLASPCDRRCTSETNHWNILESIKSIRKWTNYAVVFTNIFMPRNGAQIPDQERQGALRRLGKSVGLDNIFRCFKDKGKMQCVNCSSSGEVARPCYVK